MINERNMNEKSAKKELYKDIKKDILTISIPFSFLFLMNMFFSIIKFNEFFLSTKGMIFELIIIFLLGIMLFGILKKGKRVITAIGIIILLLSVTNQIKMAFTDEPIFISDFLYLGNIDEIGGIIKGEFWHIINLYKIPIFIEITLFILLIIWGRKIYSKIEIKNIKLRLSFIIISVIFLSVLFLDIKPINNLILNTFFNVNDRKDYEALTTIPVYYSYYGVIGGMYGQFLENKIEEPEDYDESVVNIELSSVKNNSNNNFGKPNIIVVFSESFWDINQLDEITFNKEITPNFNNLKKKGLFFDMISPSYGGISANVEYEFLTGSNVMFFNHAYVPYMQLYRNDTYYNRPSIINELKTNGYRTKIVACTSPQLFNCGKFYKYLNVDETEYLEDVEDKYKKGKYISDEYVTDKVIDEFKNKPKDEKLFYMTLTMQSHMPYTIDKYDNYDVFVENSKLTQKENDTITAYSQGIFDADKQLGRLYEYIQTIDEPTMIVFFGDHLPYLYADRNNIIDKLDYFNTGDKQLNNYKKYNTQSLILANFELKKDEENTKYLGPDLLSSYILNNMDIEVSPYYRWLYESRRIIGASNYLVTIDSEGKIYNTSNLENEYRKIYNTRKNIEYMLFVK